jgi:hypothetical protein
MLYKEGGPHKFHGGNFDYIIVDELEVDKALEDGWFLTTPEAKEAKKTKVIESKIDTDQPTRDELKIKAKELEISFDSKISTKKLGELVSKKLAE